MLQAVIENVIILMAASETDVWTGGLLLKEFGVSQYCNSLFMLLNFNKYLPVNLFNLL